MSVALREAARRIDANPLGRLMHGQRELFHSNLLAWFFDELPSAADDVFSGLTAPGSTATRAVERERQNLDLVLRWPGRAPLVIENKVFSLPDLRQLDAYATAVRSWRGDEAALCLLSMSAPELGPVGNDGLRRTSNGWIHLSYSELADRIERAVVGDSYEVETMRRYAALVRDLHELIETTSVRSEDERVWMTDEELAPVGSSQMRAALRKARAHRVADALRHHLGVPEGSIGFALTNSTPLVESFGAAVAGEVDVWAGWQLQGDQFRRAVVFGGEWEGRSVDSRQRREDVCREHPELFAFPAAVGAVAGGRKEFNHFAPGFVYRYVKAPELTIGDLTRAAEEIANEWSDGREH